MISIDKWAGVVTNASPYTIPAGAMTRQTNLQCLSPGVLQCRPGTQAVTVADPTTSPVVSMYRYQQGAQEHVMFQDSQGRIFSSVKVGTA
jgi:hypothetical protein